MKLLRKRFIETPQMGFGSERRSDRDPGRRWSNASRSGKSFVLELMCNDPGPLQLPIHSERARMRTQDSPQSCCAGGRTSRRAKGELVWDPKERGAMRGKWYIPAALLGVGGVAVFLMSENGRRWVRWVAQQLPRTPDQLLAWNEAAQRELDRIQAALNRVADSLETAQ